MQADDGATAEAVAASSNIDSLFNLAFADDGAVLRESAASPRVSRATLESMERKGIVSIDRSNPNDWLIRQVSARPAA